MNNRGLLWGHLKLLPKLLNLPKSVTGDTSRSQNNRTKYIFLNLRKMYNRNKWKNYVFVTRVKLRVELDVLVIREQPIFIQL